MKFTAISSLSMAALCLPAVCAHAQQRMNVLFIIADDMRPELGCYGVTEVITPHIDKLACGATLFQNAYCNIPVSGASRASLLTGMYPRYPDRFTAFDASADQDCPQAVSLPQCFRNNGYYAVSNGKVFHNIADNAGSWSESPWRLHPDGYGKDWAEYNKWEIWQNDASAQYVNPKTKRGPFCESADVPDTAYDDGQIAQKTIADLRRLKEQKEPFFLACGFWKPHLPFNAPKKYWDLYRRDEIKLAANPYRPKNLPRQVTGSNEIKGYARAGSLKEEQFQREAKHGYYACVSYIDAQIGLILDELERLKLADNTIVILLGDHGWHLGEHGFWGKHNLMNHATRAPLLVKVPGFKGGSAKGVVEFVDLYPTLCQLCGIPLPGKQLQGESFLPLLRNPAGKGKEYAFIQWGSGVNLVSQQYSAALWMQGDSVTGRMLFNRNNDAAENTNIADEAAARQILKELENKIKSTHHLIK